MILLLAAKVLLLIRRMVADWDKVPSGMRKPWNARDVQNLACCYWWILALY